MELIHLLTYKLNILPTNTYVILFSLFSNTRDLCISYVNYILGFKIDIILIYNYLIYNFHLTTNIWHLIYTRVFVKFKNECPLNICEPFIIIVG